jgi:hypothetical protein
VNAADYQSFGVAPGEIVDIFGILVTGTAKGSGIRTGKLQLALAGHKCFLMESALSSMLPPARRRPSFPRGGELTKVKCSVNGFYPAVTASVTDSQPGRITQDSSGKWAGSILNRNFAEFGGASRKKGSVVDGVHDRARGGQPARR